MYQSRFSTKSDQLISPPQEPRIHFLGLSTGRGELAGDTPEAGATFCATWLCRSQEGRERLLNRPQRAARNPKAQRKQAERFFFTLDLGLHPFSLGITKYLSGAGEMMALGLRALAAPAGDLSSAPRAQLK